MSDSNMLMNKCYNYTYEMAKDYISNMVQALQSQGYIVDGYKIGDLMDLADNRMIDYAQDENGIRYYSTSDLDRLVDSAIVNQVMNYNYTKQYIYSLAEACQLINAGRTRTVLYDGYSCANGYWIEEAELKQMAYNGLIDSEVYDNQYYFAIEDINQLKMNINQQEKKNNLKDSLTVLLITMVMFIVFLSVMFSFLS